MFKRSLVLIFLIFSVSLSAQILQWTPYFSSANDTIEIIYDATQGNGGLINVFPVYAHTGVITNLSTSPTDWRYVKTNWGQNTPETQMSFIGNNKWRIRFHIQSYYNVPDTETILQLAFVFRNSTGTLTGKDADGNDLYIPVFAPGLNVAIDKPFEAGIVPGNSTVEIRARASSAATNLKLYINDSEVASSTVDSVVYSFTASNQGKTRIKAVATDGVGGVKADSTYVVVRGTTPVQALPAGMQDGINYTSTTTATLVLHAPLKDYVYVIGDFNNWEIDPNYEMYRTPDNNKYWVSLNNLTPKQEYAYQYWIDNTLKVADPYAEKVLDPWNDKYIDNNRYPNLKPYPVGKTNHIVSVLQTDKTPYQWEITNFERPPVEKLVIYELLVRDFTEQQTYKSLIDTLDYLKNLGINAIEFMPIMEFEGNQSWGYNPSFHLAVDKYYGTSDDLKKFIDECHKRGIAVILDMVLNHAFGQNSMVRMYWDAANNRPAANSPWFNPIPRHPFNVGYDFNHESEATKYYVDRVNEFWLKEYKFDGFRYDLSKGFTQTNSGSNVGQWGNYDQSRINLLNRMKNAIRAYDETAYIILEHFAVDSEERALSNNGMLLWGNLNYNYSEASMSWHDGGKSNFERISYKSRGFNDPHLIGYMESHDEERVMFRNLNFGNSSGNYNIKNLNTAIGRQMLTAAFFFTVPGPKMIWQFGELGYDYSINWPCGTENCRLDPKPARWDYYDVPVRRKLYKVYSELIKLKKNYDAFNTNDFELSLANTMKRIKLTHPEMNVVIVGNFDVVQGGITPAFHSTGKWYDFFGADSINVTDVNSQIQLQPGEFKIYTTVKLPSPDPDIINSLYETHGHSHPADYTLAQNYPNPFNPSTNIEFTVKDAEFVSLTVYNMLGEKIATLVNKELSAGKYSYNFDASELPSGIYIYRLSSPSGNLSKKMILNK